VTTQFEIRITALGFSPKTNLLEGIDKAYAASFSTVKNSGGKKDG